MPTFDQKAASPAELAADLLILPVFKGSAPGPGADEVGRALDVDLVRLLKDHGMKGGVGDALTVPTLNGIPARALLLVGLGPKDEVDANRIRRAAGKVAARVSRYARVATTVPAARPGAEAVQAFVEGILLGSYRFDRYRASQDGEAPRLDRVTILGDGDRRETAEAIRRGEIFADATAFARDLVNTPALDATPAYIAKQAQKMAREVGIECKVWTKSQLQKGGFGGILGVGSGSVNEPRMIELRYRGGAGAPIALTGKGVTFDSGGLSIKDSKGMEAMKEDMAGAASVLGAMRAIAMLKPKVNVIAAIPSAENMPSGSAIRPGDVLRHRGGSTSEVLNTDAEGRLILADSLAYLAEQKPRCIVDAATLTGACMVALGEELWGVMGSNDELVRELLDAGEASGEPGWQLPLWEPYRRHIESSVADVKNVGNRWGGAITAGLFLKHFVGDIPWAHMDIAGVAFSESGGDLGPRGATGNPVRTFIRFVEAQAAKGGSGARGAKATRASGRKGVPAGRARARKATAAR